MALAVDSEMASNAGFISIFGPTPPADTTFSFTNTAGTLLVLCVGLGDLSANTPVFGTVTYGGQTMTLYAQFTTSASTGGRIGFFRLLSPPTGANNVVIGVSGQSASGKVWAGAISFTGNDTTTPLIQSASANWGGVVSTPAAASLSGVTAGNITLGLAGAGNDMTAQTQTLSFNAAGGSASAMNAGRLSRSTSSGTVSHSFTITSADAWVCAVAEVAAAGGAPPGDPPNFPVAARIRFNG